MRNNENTVTYLILKVISQNNKIIFKPPSVSRKEIKQSLQHWFLYFSALYSQHHSIWFMEDTCKICLELYAVLFYKWFPKETGKTSCLDLKEQQVSWYRSEYY